MDLSSIFVEIVSNVLILYIGVLSGFLFVKSPLKKYRKQFIEMTISGFTPVLIFVSFLNIELNAALLYPIVGASMVTVVGITAPYILTRLSGSDNPDPAEICTSTFPNALNFPFPIIYAFAPSGLGIASLFLALTTISRNTIGFWISGASLNKDSLKQMVLFPPIWAILLGIIVRFSSPFLTQNIPEIELVDIVFEIGIFATLMTVGFGLTKPKMEFAGPILRTGTSRFLIMGIISFGLVIVFNTPYFIAIPFIVQAIAPPAVYNGLYAEKLGLNTEMTSQIIIVLTMIALIFVPIEILLIQLIS